MGDGQTLHVVADSDRHSPSQDVSEAGTERKAGNSLPLITTLVTMLVRKREVVRNGAEIFFC